MKFIFKLPTFLKLAIFFTKLFTMRRMRVFYISIIVFFITSCKFEKIENGKNLSPQIIVKLKSLNLIDDGEIIQKFYSNFEKESAGSFFSDKRVAHYWINSDNMYDISFAFYHEIAAIDTVCNGPVEFDCPYILIKEKNENTFKLFIEGTEFEKKEFYNELIKFWEIHKDNHL